MLIEKVIYIMFLGREYRRKGREEERDAERGRSAGGVDADFIICISLIIVILVGSSIGKL
jgi:hypothetical protein